MAYVYFMSPAGPSVGLTSVCLGLVRALDQVGVSVGFCKPIEQRANLRSESSETHSEQYQGPERSTHLLKQIMALEPAEPIGFETAQQQMENKQADQLMEQVIEVFEKSNKDYDVMIVEGLAPTVQDNFIMKLNVLMARTLNADVILVSAKGQASLERLNDRIRRNASIFTSATGSRVIGSIVNKVDEPSSQDQGFTFVDTQDDNIHEESSNLTTIKQTIAQLPVFSETDFQLLGLLPWQAEFNAPRILDVHRLLNTKVLVEGEMRTRRVESISICARTVRNMLHRIMMPGTLIVCPGDREDVLMAASLAVMNGIPLAGILLTGDMMPEEKILTLCQPAFATGLPLLITALNTFSTAKQLDDMDISVPSDDIERMLKVMDGTANGIDAEWLKARAQIQHEVRLSPPAFRFMLSKQARSANKRIVLPEGEEIRTIRAAIYCHLHQIADCVLLGRPEQITRLASAQGFEIPKNLTILSPDAIRDQYVQPMVELRQHKGLTQPMAEAQLEDPVVIATMMLACDHVDGLVSGAINTTANTVRPALQLIKTKADASLVSSVFFMCLPEQVLVYGDCAINPEPTAEQLADIAIQSGDSAKAFGIEPRIAMISYSTGQSGSGQEVDKVKRATALAKQKRPDLIIDGPLQYDAASVKSVAAKKAPDSPVAGNATVFIFPDLNTGNTTYKAVQRSASVVSIGPMLQGLRKPVNDLSRGALVDDIVYTIALTAIQADQA
ncbi:MAG: phosphate acetyltransferase [Pseudomonadota bacterium]